MTLQGYLPMLKKLEEREAEIEKNMKMSYREQVRNTNLMMQSL